MQRHFSTGPQLLSDLIRMHAGHERRPGLVTDSPPPTFVPGQLEDIVFGRANRRPAATPGDDTAVTAPRGARSGL